MKVAVLILAVAVVGAFAQDTTPASAGPPPFKCDGNAFVCKLKELGHHIKFHAGKLGGKLASVGTSVLSSALDQGKNLLANAGQAVLGTVLEHLNKNGLVGKRELTFIQKVEEHLKSGYNLAAKAKVHIHAAFKTAVNKLTNIVSKSAALKSIDAYADKKIDSIVAAFKKNNKIGFMAMVKAISSKIKDIFTEGMKMVNSKFTQKDVKTRALADILNHLKTVGGSIADAFKPHLDTLKQGITALAGKVKEHGGKLVDAAKASFNDLKTKLSGHLTTLKGHVSKLKPHAVNAFNALKEAVASIAKQALGNASGVIGDIVKTGTDAAGVVSKHVADTAGF